MKELKDGCAVVTGMLMVLIPILLWSPVMDDKPEPKPEPQKILHSTMIYPKCK